MINKELQLDMFLYQFINKKINNDDCLLIANKIIGYYTNASMNFKSIILLESLNSNLELNNELDVKIKELNNELDLTYNDYLKVSNLKQTYINYELNTGTITYFSLIEKKYENFIYKLKEISKLNSLITGLNDFDQSNQLFLKAKQNPKLLDINKIENKIDSIIKKYNHHNYDIKNEYVFNYSKHIPNPKKFINEKIIQESSSKFKKNLLNDFLISKIDNTFTKEDYNFLLDNFKNLEKESIKLLDEYKSINELYNINKYILNKNFILFNDKLNLIIDLQESIFEYSDKTQILNLEINKILEVNEWYGQLNKTIDSLIPEINTNIYNLSIKLLSKFNAYDVLFKQIDNNQFINTIIDYQKEIKVNNSPLIQLSKENIEKTFNLLQSKSNESNIIKYSKDLKLDVLKEESFNIKS